MHLPPGRVGGLLAQASILTATSYPARTSPAKRGKWVLEALLDAPPPPPPPGVGALDDTAEDAAGLSLRERFERHRRDPSCAVCHARIDPLGFALERLDAVGRPRTRNGEFEIDDAATLPDGRRFQGARELAHLLASERGYLRSIARHLLTYALGRGLGPGDERTVEGLVTSLEAEPTLSGLIRGIVRTDAFRRIRLEESNG